MTLRRRESTTRGVDSGSRRLSDSPSFLLNLQKPTFRLGESGSRPERIICAVHAPSCEGRLGKCVNVQMSVMSSRIPDRKIA